MKKPCMPRPAEVIVTFNGSSFHLKGGKCYRRVVGLLLRRYREGEIVLLVPDASDIPILNKSSTCSRECIAALQSVFEEEIRDKHACIKTHGGVLGIASALVVRANGTNRAFYFNHNSQPVEQEVSVSDRLWARFSTL